jgi:hypothetical protein
MRRGFHAVLAAILVAFLIAPLGMLCATNCQPGAHDCCARAPQLAHDCCTDHAGSHRAVAPGQSRAEAAPVSFSPAIESAFDSLSIRVVTAPNSSSGHPHQTPPMVLRT